MLTSNEDYINKNYEKALTDVFVEIDYLLINEEGHEKMQEVLLELKREVRGPTAKLDMAEIREIKSIPFAAGCTSCVCLITPDTIYCANSGDSRAILVNKAGKVTELSHDHKPDDAGELKRIKADGGFVEDGRVQGIIAVSRALGDWEYKNPDLLQQQMAKSPMKKKSLKAASTPSPTPKTGPYRNIEEAKKHQVSSYPDIKRVPIKADHDFIVLACDGIWDCYTNEQAAKYVRTKREKGPKSGMTVSMANTPAGKAKLNAKIGGSRSSGIGSSPLKISKTKSETAKKTKIKGDISFIIEEMMDHGIAKGDITMSDGTGTDNMTCIIIQFRDESDVSKDESTAAESGYEKEEYKR